MSKYVNGILGPFSGKVGPVVGSKWKDKFVMRSRPYPHQDNPTALQMVQRDRFALMSEAMRCLAGAVNIGFMFNAKASKMSARNIAMSENMENAMTQSGNTWAINYMNMVVARGNFSNVSSLTATVSGSNINLAWVNNIGSVIGFLPSGTNVIAVDNDEVKIVIWNATKKEAIYDKFSSYTREDAAATIPVPAGWVSTDEVYAFVFVLPESVDRYIKGTGVTPVIEAQAKELIEGGYGASSSAIVRITL